MLTLLYIILGLSTHLTMAALSVVEHPKSYSLHFGQNISLNCQFNEPVNCTWDREDIPTIISGRYVYLSYNGINTTDCSLEIRNFKQIDIATWQCKAMDKTRTPAVLVKSSLAKLENEGDRKPMILFGVSILIGSLVAFILISVGCIFLAKLYSRKRAFLKLNESLSQFSASANHFSCQLQMDDSTETFSSSASKLTHSNSQNSLHNSDQSLGTPTPNSSHSERNNNSIIEELKPKTT